jgi:hypothetical protein
VDRISNYQLRSSQQSKDKKWFAPIQIAQVSAQRRKRVNLEPT